MNCCDGDHQPFLDTAQPRGSREYFWNDDPRLIAKSCRALRVLLEVVVYSALFPSFLLAILIRSFWKGKMVKISRWEVYASSLADLALQVLRHLRECLVTHFVSYVTSRGDGGWWGCGGI